MSFPEYGRLIEKAPPKAERGTFEEFGEPVKDFSRARSVIGAPIKGAIKGALSMARIPLFSNKGAIPEKLQKRLLEEALPTYDKPLEGVLERAGEIGVGMVGGTGGLASKAIRTGIGALAGEATKRLGGGETAQSIAEFAGTLGPDLAKKIPVGKAQEKMVNFLRKRGFTENEITPFLQSEKSLSRLGKFASKGEKTNKLMKDTYSKFENVYGGLREEGEKLPGLAEPQINEFMGEFQKKMDRIPRRFSRMIKEDVNDLLNSEMKFNDFMDLNQAINATIGTSKGGKAVVGILKEPISKAQANISPQLRGDYELANMLYGKGRNIRDHLKTKQIEDLYSISEEVGLFSAIADYNVGLLTKSLGAIGMRKLVREMLINPRLQNISRRMLEAAKQNKIPNLIKLGKIFEKEAQQSLSAVTDENQ